MKHFVLFAYLYFIFNVLFCQGQTPPNSKIKVYFNHPVDTTVSTGVKAIYLNKLADDTLIAYINRAKFTIDIAVYDFIQDTSISNIASAVNKAYKRGVVIRWIYNTSCSNAGLDSLNKNIHTLGSPTSDSYGIMHNKFMIIDANSADDSDPIVWSGSMNWDDEQINLDVNNVIIIQDKSLAQAYTSEFNEMWGSTGNVPDSTNSKFGPYKTYTTQHIFSIGGDTVELFFSPTDSTNTHILKTISSANTDLYFGVYTFTMESDADSIVKKNKQGVFVAGILDQYSDSYYSYYGILKPALGDYYLKIYKQNNSIYHSKFAIVDPSNPLSDPMVLTGSHNWTETANTKNDENTLIVHSASIANIYYQSFYKNFTDLGGSLPVITGTHELRIGNGEWRIYPNPVNSLFFVSYQLSENSQVNISLCDITGREVADIINENQGKGEHVIKINTEKLENGIYILKFSNTDFTGAKKVVVKH